MTPQHFTPTAITESFRRIEVDEDPGAGEIRDWEVVPQLPLLRGGGMGEELNNPDL